MLSLPNSQKRKKFEKCNKVNYAVSAVKILQSANATNVVISFVRDVTSRLIASVLGEPTFTQILALKVVMTVNVFWQKDFALLVMKTFVISVGENFIHMESVYSILSVKSLLKAEWILVYLLWMVNR